jgi:hypothetical protein
MVALAVTEIAGRMKAVEATPRLSVLPDWRVTIPVPSTCAAMSLRIPESTVVPPVKVFATEDDKVRVPVPPM